MVNNFRNGWIVSSISDPSATFSGIAGITYELSWTMINGPCSSSDNVLITFNHDIPIANAGPNQTICSTSSNLAAMAPSTGIGTWTLLAGFGIIANPNVKTRMLQDFRMAITYSGGQLLAEHAAVLMK